MSAFLNMEDFIKNTRICEVFFFFYKQTDLFFYPFSKDPRKRPPGNGNKGGLKSRLGGCQSKEFYFEYRE